MCSEQQTIRASGCSILVCKCVQQPTQQERIDFSFEPLLVDSSFWMLCIYQSKSNRATRAWPQESSNSNSAVRSLWLCLSNFSHHLRIGFPILVSPPIDDRNVLQEYYDLMSSAICQYQLPGISSVFLLLFPRLSPISTFVFRLLVQRVIVVCGAASELHARLTTNFCKVSPLCHAELGSCKYQLNSRCGCSESQIMDMLSDFIWNN